jgi:hypothetical protein
VRPLSSSNSSADRDSARGTSEPILVDARSAAATLSISERAFHVLRKRPDFPKNATVVIGPRCIRFRVETLHAFVLSLVKEPQGEPIQLRRSREPRHGRSRRAGVTNAGLEQKEN